MEFKFTFLPEFHRTLKDLPRDRQRQIVKKIADIANIKDQSIFRHVKSLSIGIDRTTHRLRVGDIIQRKDAY